MRRLGMVAVLTAGVIGLFCLASAAFAAEKDVTIAGFAFSPSTVTVSVGDTVTWTNNDGATHTATADGGQFDTGNISGGGGSDSVTFNSAGTFAYHCQIHSAMTGTVVVRAASRGGGSPTTPPTDTARPGSGSTGFAPALGAMAFIALTPLIVARRLGRTARS
jgi:plastocyanin